MNLKNLIKSILNIKPTTNSTDWSEDLPIISRRNSNLDIIILLEIQTAESGALIFSKSEYSKKFTMRNIEVFDGNYDTEYNSINECLEALEKIPFRGVTNDIIKETAWLSKKLMYINPLIKDQVANKIKSYSEDKLRSTARELQIQNSGFHGSNFRRWIDFLNLNA